MSKKQKKVNMAEIKEKFDKVKKTPIEKLNTQVVNIIRAVVKGEKSTTIKIA